MQNSKNQVIQELQNLAKDLKELLADEALQGNSKAKDLREQLEGKIDDIRLSAKELSHEATAHAKHAVKAADDYAHEKPWHLISAGATIGLVLGLLLGRR